jgi:hypothetical protein
MPYSLQKATELASETINVATCLIYEQASSRAKPPSSPGEKTENNVYPADLNQLFIKLVHEQPDIDKIRKEALRSALAKYKKLKEDGHVSKVAKDKALKVYNLLPEQVTSL